MHGQKTFSISFFYFSCQKLKSNLNKIFPTRVFQSNASTNVFWRILGWFEWNRLGTSTRLWINQWIQPIKRLSWHSPEHKFGFIGFMERKVKLILIFMKHSFRSPSLSGPLHPSIYDAFRWDFFISHCGSRHPRKSLAGSLFLCSTCFIAPHIHVDIFIFIRFWTRSF